MTDVSAEAAASAVNDSQLDPRNLLADWANHGDEWVRRIVRLVLATGRAPADADVEGAHQLFLEEKQLAERKAGVEAEIAVELDAAEREAPLSLVSIAEVVGVNALMTGSSIELSPGLTILFGENGTGKTGYARIVKMVANSRTADEILPDVYSAGPPTPIAAKLVYRLGDKEVPEEWHGGRGEAPFTRISVFDSPAVAAHVDSDLDYVYTPQALALFDHVNHGLVGVQALIDAEIRELKGSPNALLTRFDRKAAVYPAIETLGAATDLDALRQAASVPADAEDRREKLRAAVAALRGNTIEQQITLQQRVQRVVEEARRYAVLAAALPLHEYNACVDDRARLSGDYEAFRRALFAAADLPAEPDATWDAFVRGGEAYKSHLAEADAHDASRCLYCRQPLSPEARALLDKYADYLADKIARDIAAADTSLQSLARPVLQATLRETAVYVNESAERQDDPTLDALRSLLAVAEAANSALSDKQHLDPESLANLPEVAGVLDGLADTATNSLNDLREQSEDRAAALTEKETALREFEASLELKRTWSAIEDHVNNARRADKLNTLAKKIPGILRQLTELSKTASNQLINQNFEERFEEECTALRAPKLRLQFVGKQGRAHRRKTLAQQYKPSQVLSEGEQKVLALADFLAEARLHGINAPIVFDDPVCSLDHRRIEEVARRVSNLAVDGQVIVFTHDILFATSLLAKAKDPNRCTYYQVTDETGKGLVTRASGPRWDTPGNLKKEITKTIAAAQGEGGETRAALVRTGYDWVRSWCEVFVEHELLADVTQRYQPNVRMTLLRSIKTSALPDAIETVVAVFDDACRYIDGHSQPLPSLGVAPTLQALEADWTKLQECQRAFRAAP